VGAADGYDEISQPPHHLGGSDSAVGQATGTLTTPLAFNAAGGAVVRLIIGTGATPDRARAALDAERARSFGAEWDAVTRDWAAWFRGATLPTTGDARVLEVARRSLITMRLAVDPETGAIVASADIQAPYGEDWIRDGSFINEALDLAGFHDLVTRHNLFEASAQTSATNPDPLRPPGNWPMMVYSDGVPSGQIPYEIDETGLGAWTLWEHARFLPAAAAHRYLQQVYPALARAAGWLTACRDPANGFQCSAHEDDSVSWSQTLHGAGPVLLGLRAALAAAAVVGDHSPVVQTWRDRAATLQSAIDGLYDPARHAYREGPARPPRRPSPTAAGCCGRCSCTPRRIRACRRRPVRCGSR
jgi:GH15 family glucan-1,4-alpha-glucosidase